MSQRYLGGVITANPTTPTLTTESGVWTLEQQFQYSSTWSPEIIGNSIRLRSSASAYLTRTPAAAGNLTTWTWSGWVKRGTLSVAGFVFGAGTVSSNDTGLYFETDNTLVYSKRGSINVQTSQVFRDTSAWYHIVIAFDSTQATSSNRLKMYVNGVQVTSFATATYPTASETTQWNNNVASYIGRRGDGVYFDGYMAEVYFVDGQALTPSSFGAFDTNGIWQPLGYTGTFGTNGFYVDFSDNSAATAAALGKDYSGNGNNWTPNNISLTAGATYDWMLDSPSNYPNASTGIGNYATLSAVDKASGITLADGNLRVVSQTGGGIIRGTIAIPTTGKWYWEITYISGVPQAGIATTDTLISTTYLGAASTTWAYLSSSGVKYNNGSSSAYGASWNTSGDVCGVAFDADAGTLTFYKNGTSQGTAYSSLTAGNYVPALGQDSGQSVYANFGQRPFAQSVPSGYKSLCTQNMPAVNINNGAQYMAATTYTGTGAALAISNGNNTTIGTTFQPDFVWIKYRGGVSDHGLFDSVRGRAYSLVSNTTAAEQTSGSTQDLTSFNSNGFSLGTSYQINDNTSSNTYIAWQWKAGAGTTSSNTSGSITSTTSVNATAGFSVVTFTATGSNATVGHGLGVAPAMVILKDRASTGNWAVWHKSLPSAAYYLYMNTTAAQGNTAAIWNSTAPTSSVVSIGTWSTADAQVMYCWSEVAGYSKFGSYTGNGSTDGPFVYLGFTPKWVLLKCTSTTSGWLIIDTSRQSYNVEGPYLLANTSDAETTGTTVFDLLSNGFKMRSSSTLNTSSATYIYAAFAENPFNLSRAR